LISTRGPKKHSWTLSQSPALLIETVSYEWYTTTMTSATLTKVPFSNEKVFGVNGLYIPSMMSSLVPGLQRTSLPALHLSDSYYGISMQPHMRDVRRYHTEQAQRTRGSRLKTRVLSLHRSVSTLEMDTRNRIYVCIHTMAELTSSGIRPLKVPLSSSTIAKLTTPNYTTTILLGRR
jgi:hypothetical protein